MDVDVETIVRETIGQLRREHGSYEKVARALGVSTSTVVRWERGAHLDKGVRALIPHVRRLFCSNKSVT